MRLAVVYRCLFSIVGLSRLDPGRAAGLSGRMSKAEFNAVRHVLLSIAECDQDGDVNPPLERDIVGVNLDVAQHVGPLVLQTLA